MNSLSSLPRHRYRYYHLRTCVTTTNRNLSSILSNPSVTHVHVDPSTPKNNTQKNHPHEKKKAKKMMMMMEERMETTSTNTSENTHPTTTTHHRSPSSRKNTTTTNITAFTTSTNSTPTTTNTSQTLHLHTPHTPHTDTRKNGVVSPPQAPTYPHPRQDGIERLRAAFLQSMQVDRERRIQAMMNPNHMKEKNRIPTHPTVPTIHHSQDKKHNQYQNQNHNGQSQFQLERFFPHSHPATATATTTTTNATTNANTNHTTNHTTHMYHDPDASTHSGGTNTNTNRNHNHRNLDSNMNSIHSSLSFWRHHGTGAKEFRDRRKLALRQKFEQEQQRKNNPILGNAMTHTNHTRESSVHSQPSWTQSHHNPTQPPSTQSLTFVQNTILPPSHHPSYPSYAQGKTHTRTVDQLQKDLLQENQQYGKKGKQDLQPPSFLSKPIHSKQQQRQEEEEKNTTLLESTESPLSSFHTRVEKQIRLPNRSTLTLSELSQLLQVKITLLVQTLQTLGETVPLGSTTTTLRNRNPNRTPTGNKHKPTTTHPKQEHLIHHNLSLSDHRIDIDVAELVALELGIDTIRDTRKRTNIGKKWSHQIMMEMAERRLKRKGGGGGGGGETNTIHPENQDTTTDQRHLNFIENHVNGKSQGISTLDLYHPSEDDQWYQSLPPRPPVVCIMGHVDHGKTTLMDTLRKMASSSPSSSSFKHNTDNGSDKGIKTHSSTKKKITSSNVIGSELQSVAGTEAGGITQTVSAFQVPLPGISSISLGDTADMNSHRVSTVTFLDTPGHAAFKSMRQSGSNCADVIVLVIAADDGVSKQTVEIIDMYKSIARSQPGSISMVVALNKIDKPGIDVKESIRRVENELLQHDIYTESMTIPGVEFGGIQLIPVSGLSGLGIDDLVEGLALQSEIMNLRAEVETRAEGLVVDARMENGLGVVADCIIRWGKLEKGDYVVSGIHGGKVRMLNDANNKALAKALPSQPVRIIGLRTLPKAGDPIVCVQSEEIAKEIIIRRQNIIAINEDAISYRAENFDSPEVQITGAASKHGVTTRKVLDKYGLNDNEKNDTVTTIRIPVVIKADADGSLDAVRECLIGIASESKLNLCIDPVEVSIGHITTSDVRIAAESGASLFCFNLKGSKDKAAMALAESEGVRICSNNVIYHLLDEAKQVFSTYLPPVPTDKVHGTALVQAVFDINNKKDAERVAGLKVHEGSLYLEKSNKESGSLTCEYRVKRGGNTISSNLRAKTLRKVKDDVKEVRRGDECGLCLGGFSDLEEGDIIECFSTEMVYTFV